MGLTVTASSPGRCGIVGNPSDIYGGRVISCSIPARSTCEVRCEPGPVPPETRLWSAALKRLPVDLPVSVTWHTDVPRSSGLSGSTALLASMVACLSSIRGESRMPTELAELVRDIERNDAGIVCGYQDAYMIAFGGLQFMDFAGKRPDRAGPVAHVSPIEADLPFLLITTGVERLSGSVHGPMVERWLAGEPLVVDSMTRIAVLADIGRSAITSSNMGDLGDAMNENHRLVAALGGSGEAIDQLVADCLEEGCFGAKLAGAGLGGTVIALHQEPDQLEKRLRLRGYDRFLRPARVPGTQVKSDIL